MRKINLLIAVTSILFLTSCTQRGCQRWEKDTQFTERSYRIDVYSGGKPVFTDQFRGIVNGEDKTDGIYYFKGDTLVEISGDYVLKSLK